MTVKNVSIGSLTIAKKKSFPTSDKTSSARLTNTLGPNFATGVTGSYVSY